MPRHCRLAAVYFKALALAAVAYGTLGIAGPAEAAPIRWTYSGYVDFGGVPGYAAVGDPVTGDIIIDPLTPPVSPGQWTLPGGQINLEAGSLSLAAGNLTAAGGGLVLTFFAQVPSSSDPAIYDGELTISFHYNAAFDPLVLPVDPPVASEKLLMMFYHTTPGGTDNSILSATLTGLAGPFPVPEPASGALFGVGLLTLAAMLARRAHRRPLPPAPEACTPQSGSISRPQDRCVQSLSCNRARR